MSNDDQRQVRIDKLKRFGLRFRALQRRGRPKPGEVEYEPVEPKKPNTLSGGAAAALEFDS